MQHNDLMYIHHEMFIMISLMNTHHLLWGFPHSSAGKKSACNAGDLGSIPGSGRPPGEGMQPTPVFLPEEFHGQGSLAGYSPWGHKSWT